MSEAQIKAAVRARDGMRCTECGMTNKQHRARYGKSLDVHRLVPGSAYTVETTVTLCRRCHGPKPRRAHATYASGIRLPADLVRDVRIIAPHFKEKPKEYIIRVIREALRVDIPRTFKKWLEEIERRHPAEDGEER